MSHPHQLHAIAALWSLRAARYHLAAYREAAVIRRPQLGPPTSRRRTLAQLRAHDELLRAERADIAAAVDTRPVGGSPAPIAPGLIDLEVEVAAALTGATDLVAYVHRGHPVLHWSPDWRAVLVDVFRIHRDPRWTYLSVALPATPPGIAAEVAALLEHADARVRAVCGLGPDHTRPAAPVDCPACQERRLRIQSSAPTRGRWTVVCTNGRCRCLGVGDPTAGDGCPCRMPVRVAGVRHIWDATSPLAAAAIVGNTNHQQHAA